MRRSPFIHSSISVLLLKPVTFTGSTPGNSARIFQSSSAIRTGLKTYFCFGHAPLWQRLDQQSKVPKVSQVDIEGNPVHDKPLFPIDMAYSRHMPSFTAEQATAGRAFLGWSRHELGAASGLSFKTVRDFEYDIQSATTKSVEAIRAPFHHAGVDFTGVASGPV